MSAAPQVRGWCPGALTPMMSGDGLALRVRPRQARLTVAQALGLCDLAERFAQGALELTNRANLQMHGLAEADHPAVLERLAALGLLDADPEQEARRNLLVTPFWQAGDLTDRLGRAVAEALPQMPALPAKMGIAVDTGAAPLLGQDPADFRFERAADGLILRADGASMGRVIREQEAAEALIDMARWFVATRSPAQRRMKALTAVTAVGDLPAGWATAAPLPGAPHPPVGRGLYAAAFGHVDAAALRDLLTATGAEAIRITPWRAFALEGGRPASHPAFITDPDDPLLRAAACRGAPGCPQASVETRALARRLAPLVPGLHVSGCAKGCARAAASGVTLVGRDGAFDLIEEGCAGDAPRITGLDPARLPDVLPETLTRTLRQTQTQTPTKAPTRR